MATVIARVLATGENISLQESFLKDGVKYYKDLANKEYKQGEIELVSVNGRKVNWATQKLRVKPKAKVRKIK